MALLMASALGKKIRENDIDSLYYFYGHDTAALESFTKRLVNKLCPADAQVMNFHKLDGKTLDEKDYTKAEGSIIVTLNNNFVSTLSVGEHTLGIVSESGTATAKFTVKASEIPNESPKTGDDNMVAVWSFAAVLSLAVLGFTTVVSKKKRAK